MINKLLTKLGKSEVIKLTFTVVGLIFVNFSYGQQSQSYAPYDATQISAVTSADLLKSTNLPVIGTGAVTLTVFFDYNCHYSRELLWVLDQYISGTAPNFTTTNNTKIVYRPMDYGFNSREVAQAVLFAKNLSPVNFTNINNNIKSRTQSTTAVVGDRVNFNRPLDAYDLVTTVFPAVGVTGLSLDANYHINTVPALNNVNEELDKNKSDFEALPFPLGLDSKYSKALPVIIISNANASKMLYFIGTDKISLDQAIGSM